MLALLYSNIDENFPDFLLLPRKVKIDSFFIQVSLEGEYGLMKEIIQKASSTDKQITLALLRSDWLSYLLSIGSKSAVALSVFSVAAILGIEPVQANLQEQSVSPPEQTIEEEQTLQVSSNSTEQDCSVVFPQNLEGELLPTAEEDFTTIANLKSNLQPAERLGEEVEDNSVVLASHASESTAQKPVDLACTEANNLVSLSPEPTVEELTTLAPALVAEPLKAGSELNSVEYNLPEQLVVAEEAATLEQVFIPSSPPTKPAPQEVPSNALAQASVETAQEPPLIPQNSPPENDALSPTLKLQGVVVNQEDTSARARLTGVYPVSPHALFGATVDLTTGEGLADSQSEGLDLNELYFAGSLPELPELRLIAGQLDLTSYFDRNSFAKDETTHFFNPVFHTNPALAAAGIGSRPAVLLNWNITDNIEAKATGFSSDRSLGDLDLDGFAAEIGFRAGTAIIRGTYVTAKDVRENGFEEIFGIERDNGEFGPDSDDREQAIGINAEVFVPELNMGLFARYGWYENQDLDEGGNTYSVGVSFLDLLMPDDRLGLGYGRKLSNDDLRRDQGDEVPDVWELFYDFRLSPNLRAGVTLQGRDEFSDTILGFRVKTEFDLLGSGR